LGEESEEIDNVLTKKHEVVHTFGWYVRRMVAEVKERGATPIVLSLTVRNIWSDGVVERGSGHYRQWDREIAQAAGVEFVDLTRIVADEYQELGDEKVKALFSTDHTHTNTAGADFNAARVVAGLKGIRKGPFGNFLSAKGAAIEADKTGWLNLPEPANPKLPSLVLIGDSTVGLGRLSRGGVRSGKGQRGESRRRRVEQPDFPDARPLDPRADAVEEGRLRRDAVRAQRQWAAQRRRARPRHDQGRG
jgi:hypothetical protein